MSERKEKRLELLQSVGTVISNIRKIDSSNLSAEEQKKFSKFERETIEFHKFLFVIIFPTA